MEFEKNVITSDGLELLAKVQSGSCNIVFTKVAVGDGDYTEVEKEYLAEATGLKSHQRDYPFVDHPYIQNNSQVVLRAIIGNRELTEGFHVKEYGIFATDPDKGEILYAIAIVYPNKASWLPPYDGCRECNLKINSFLAVANKEQVSIEETSFDYVAFDVFENHVNDAGKHPSEEKKRAWDETYEQSTGYTDRQIADLINGAPETLDTLKEVADAMKENETVVDALNAAIGTKANEAEVDSLFTAHKTSTDHDGRYYTETEVNNLLNPLKIGIMKMFQKITYDAERGGFIGFVGGGYTTGSYLETVSDSLSALANAMPRCGGTFSGGVACNKGLDVTGVINVNGAIYSEGTINMTNTKYLRSTNTSNTTLNLIGINDVNNVHIGAYYSSSVTDPANNPVYIHAKGFTYKFHDTALFPGSSNTCAIGTSGSLWSTVYAKTGTINTSDRTKKHDIKDLTTLHEQLFLRLSPKSFVFNDGDRVHIGAISQDVEDAMIELGITAKQFAGFCKDIRYEYTEFNDVDGEPIESSKAPVRDADGNIVYDYSLRYQEFIFLTIHMVQKLYDRVDRLESEVAGLKNLILNK